MHVIAQTKSSGFKVAAIISLALTLSGMGIMMTCLEGKDVLTRTLLVGMVGFFFSGIFAIEAWPKTANGIGAISFIGGGALFVIGLVLIFVGIAVAAITNGFLGVFYAGLIGFFGGIFMMFFAFAIAQAVGDKA